ncbi:MAG: hypothetical protein M0R38_12690 [Bacteroidia bacterium]|nr:hypothetical protein [Bacteroidia bacterium]
MSKLSQAEKEKRLLHLSALDDWKKKNNSNSDLDYSKENGIPYSYLRLITSWRRSTQRRTNQTRRLKKSQSFVKIKSSSNINNNLSEPLTIVVGKVSILVPENSSNGNLRKVLSVLGLENVFTT